MKVRKDLSDLRYLIARHVKLYFKEKQTFFMSMITPLVLVVLFATFLRSVYTDSFLSFFEGTGIEVSDKALGGFVSGWLISSILGTTSVTLAFCSQTIMVTDKINRRIEDFRISPVRPTVLSVSYFIATFISTLVVCLICLVIGLLYVAASGWYLSAGDLALCLFSLVICALFGSLLAVIVETFLKTSGAVSAWATLMSSMYGFLCGAYMPISQFSAPIRHFVSFIPGTYGTMLFRRSMLRGVLTELEGVLPAEAIKGLGDGFDYTLYFLGRPVSVGAAFAVVGISVLVLGGIYIAIVCLLNRKRGEKEIKKGETDPQ